MAGEIQDIIDELIVIERTVAAPEGEKAIAEYFDEFDHQALVFPCFVNVEAEMSDFSRGAGTRRYAIAIDMHLLFAGPDEKYSLRSRRRWVKPVLDAFDKAIALNLAQLPVQHAAITRVGFEPIDLFDQEYTGVTFELTAQTSEAFTFEP